MSTDPHVLETLALTRTGAHAVLEAAVAAAQRQSVAVVVWVVDAGGHDVAMTRMDGSPLLSRQVAADKAWTAAAFGRSTSWWVDLLAEQSSLGALAHGNRLMAVPGGEPLGVRRASGLAVVGGVGVSGGTAEQDADIALEATHAL